MAEEKAPLPRTPPRLTSVFITRATMQQFTDQAGDAWPYETTAILIGRVKGRRAWIGDILQPRGREVRGTKNRCFISHSFYERALRYAREDGRVVLGDIHTHPWKRINGSAVCLSRADYKAFDYLRGIGVGSPICGVMSVQPHRSNPTLMCETAFWVEGTPLKLRVVMNVRQAH